MASARDATPSKRVMRAAAIAGVAGQVLFTLGWFMAGLMQGDAYSIARHDISDMGAGCAVPMGAPDSTRRRRRMHDRLWTVGIPAFAGRCARQDSVHGSAHPALRRRQPHLPSVPSRLSCRRRLHRGGDHHVVACNRSLRAWSPPAGRSGGAIRRCSMSQPIATVGGTRPPIALLRNRNSCVPGCRDRTGRNPSCRTRPADIRAAHHRMARSPCLVATEA
jgi:hypothetical protein